MVTTGFRPGYLRKNGVPYSANAVVTEYYNRTNEPNGDSWLVVTTVVEDPIVSERPVRHQLAFQESDGRVGVESNAMRGQLRSLAGMQRSPAR